MKTAWIAIVTTLLVALGLVLLRPLWFWISWEIAGGVLVAVGCIGEWYLFKHQAKPDQEHVHRTRELQFITAVALGVTMELISLSHSIPEGIRLEKDVAAANERASTNELQVAQLTKTNLLLENKLLTLKLQIEALEPTNQPIFDLSAFVHVRVRGSNHVDMPKWGSPHVAGLTLASNPHLAAVGVGSGPLLKCDAFERAFAILPEAGDSREYFMHFNIDPVGGSFFSSLGAASDLSTMDALGIYLKFLPLDSEILGGVAKVTVNSSIKREFDIKPQRAFKPLTLTNQPGYHDSFHLIATFGTNQLPANPGPEVR